MSMLAEIGDKMWSVHGMFMIALLLAACTSFLGIVRWWLAAPSLLLALYGNRALVQEMQAPGMWDAISRELGWPWVIGSFVAWNAAFGFCWSGLTVVHRWRVRHGRSAEDGCTICGYDLTGNVSGVCPECGTNV